MKRRYELTVIFSPELSSSDQKSTVKAIEDLVKKAEGTVVKQEEWGVKDFAYSIQKHASGIYHFFVIELAPKTISGFSGGIKLISGVLRHLLVRVGD